MSAVATTVVREDGAEEAKCDLAKRAAKYGWKVGVVKHWSEKDWGFVEVNGVSHHFNANNHCQLTSFFAGKNNMEPSIWKMGRIKAKLLPEDEIIVLVTGPGRDDRPKATKWCFAEQLDAEEQLCSMMPEWCISSLHWCNGKEREDRAVVLWEGNDTKTLAKYIRENRDKLMDYPEKCGSNHWEHQCYLQQRRFKEDWEDVEPDNLPSELSSLYTKDGFGRKPTYRHQ